MKDPQLILLTKKPIPGEVKTRLLPYLSAEDAAQLSIDMTQDTVTQALNAWTGPLRMLASPDPDHPALQRIAQRHSISISPQAAGNLGQKMHEALEIGLRNAPAAAILGCDIPTISQSILRFASHKLKQGFNVIGPAADGGFYFAGLTQCKSGMFDQIQWGSNTVFASTVERSASLGIRFDVVLPCLQDIDEYDDLVNLAQISKKYRKYIT